ncbi:MAG: DUF4342 domain-containing protein [Erysipelotrichaceae bacterium]|nr:DUF4342 domain-containing protein [Erysipelotrichaceae bacterium]
MNFTLQEVDQVIARTGCSYQEAKELLEKADGDVLDAVILYESRKETEPEQIFRGFEEKSQKTGEDILAAVKKAIEEGSARKLVVRDPNGKKIISVSLNTGVAVGAVALFAGAAPLAVISGLIAKYGLNCSFILVNQDGSETIL